MCDTCGYQSERPDDFREIEINFKVCSPACRMCPIACLSSPLQNNARLEDCITAYLKSEKLDGDNK